MLSAWAQTSVVTFNLNMENVTASSSGVFLGGGVMGDGHVHGSDFHSGYARLVELREMSNPLASAGQPIRNTFKS